MKLKKQLRIKKLQRLVFPLIFAGAGLFSNSLHAQLIGGNRVAPLENGPKGKFMIYGALNYNRTDNGDGKSSGFWGTSVDGGMPIGIGYYLNNNNLLGVNYSYASHRLDGKTISRQNETGLWYSSSLPLGKYFALIGQVDASYVWGERLLQQGLEVPRMQDYNGYRLKFYPMLAIFAGGGWTLRFKFAEMSLLQTKAKGEGWRNSYVAGVGATSLGVGVSKDFGGGRK
ncbi:hypothetical protein [Elizabethkingia anophelis]|uniref:hypothetical protein n=1 Tax=Elizabethkingia anophelis TaxID=1117645 RepID=UPI0029372F24